MKTDNVPALVMLSAGCIECVIAIYTGQPLLSFTKQLLIILLIFFVLGSIVKMILDRYLGEKEEPEEMDLSEMMEMTDEDEVEDNQELESDLGEEYAQEESQE